MDTSPNTRPNVVDETTNPHVNIDDKEIELLIIASIETFIHQNKKRGKEDVFALVKEYLEEAIAMESFEKYLALLQASNSIKCNVISNRTCLSIPKHSSIPKVCIQNTSIIKNDFEDFKSNFIETLNVQKELFMNQQNLQYLTNRINFYRNEFILKMKA